MIKFKDGNIFDVNNSCYIDQINGYIMNKIMWSPSCFKKASWQAYELNSVRFFYLMKKSMSSKSSSQSGTRRSTMNTLKKLDWTC